MRFAKQLLIEIPGRQAAETPWAKSDSAESPTFFGGPKSGIISQGSDIPPSGVRPRSGRPEHTPQTRPFAKYLGGMAHLLENTHLTCAAEKNTHIWLARLARIHVQCKRDQEATRLGRGLCRRGERPAGDDKIRSLMDRDEVPWPC